jgi:uncharacterized protein involved in response to NO
MSLIGIEEPGAPAGGKQGLMHHPVLRLGFRPFYLLAAAFAAVSVPLWMARYYGWVAALPHVNLNWHMHEMVFGFAIAVIIGFLFTAGRNWTGLWTPRRGHLAALAGVWLAGRIAMLLFPPPFAAVVDLLFLPLAAWPMYRVLARSGNKRNMFLVGLLALLFSANATYHAAVLGWIELAPAAAIHAAILIIVIIEFVIGGRVIPGFTANGVPGSKPITNERRDRVAIALTVLAALGWISGISPPLTAALAAVAGCAQLLRLVGWKPHVTLSNPLVWILHLSYAWIPVGFFALALAALGMASSSLAFHMLGLGATAGLIIGMITRTALGHTGRPLKAGRAEVAMYVLLHLGVVARLMASLPLLALRDPMLVLAAACFSGAFLLYVAVYGPYLFRPRIDGRDG